MIPTTDWLKECSACGELCRANREICPGCGAKFDEKNQKQRIIQNLTEEQAQKIIELYNDGTKQAEAIREIVPSPAGFSDTSKKTFYTFLGRFLKLSAAYANKINDQEWVERHLNKVFNSSYSVEENGCWNWKNDLKTKTLALIRGKFFYARDYIYEKRFGKFNKENLIIVTTCTNRRCVNPEHLVLQKFYKKGAVKVIDIEGKIFEFPTVVQAAKFIGKSQSYINAKLLKKKKFLIGNYTMERIAAENEENLSVEGLLVIRKKHKIRGRKIAEDNFNKGYEIVGDHWLWQKYRKIRVNNYNRHPRTFSYEKFYGKTVSREDRVVNNCKVKNCINPNHLEVMSNSDFYKKFHSERKRKRRVTVKNFKKTLSPKQKLFYDWVKSLNGKPFSRMDVVKNLEFYNYSAGSIIKKFVKFKKLEVIGSGNKSRYKMT